MDNFFIKHHLLMN